MKKLLLATTLTFSMVASAYANDPSDWYDNDYSGPNMDGNPEEYLCNREGQELTEADVEPIAQITLQALGYDPNDAGNVEILRPVAEETVLNHNAGANCSDNANNNNGNSDFRCQQRCKG